jgi:GTP-binding protein
VIFKDEVEIHVKAGKGGDGAATFRREKYVDHGGPDGGDGGYGGDVLIRADVNLRTLSHIHNRQRFKAKNGHDGKKQHMTGAMGESITITVPQGTQVYDTESGELICDLTGPESEFIVAYGGRGGAGNTHFKSSTNQTPFYAKPGKPGEERTLRLDLRLIAHVGLVGFPNAGKSTLISKITNARPKIADYPFTTLEPNLGVMTPDGAYASVLIADIPGLIEGAHEGKGLGIEFLKHIERTKIILYILDISDEPMKKFEILRDELRGYSETLASRRFMVALNKIDLMPDQKETEKITKKFKKLTPDVMTVCALQGSGLKDLEWTIYNTYVECEKRDKEAALHETASKRFDF